MIEAAKCLEFEKAAELRDQLYALEELCFEPPYRFSRRYIRQLVSRANAATWIAEEAGQIDGFAIVEWNHEPDEMTAYIQTIEVAPEMRGHGVGRELLGRTESSARLAGAGAGGPRQCDIYRRIV